MSLSGRGTAERAVLALLAVVLALGFAVQARYALHRLRVASDLALTTTARAEERLLGERDATALRLLRQVIPSNGVYGLVVPPGTAEEAFAIRYALAPRRAVLVAPGTSGGDGSLARTALPSSALAVEAARSDTDRIRIVRPSPEWSAAAARDPAPAAGPLPRRLSAPRLLAEAARALRTLFSLLLVLGSGAWAALLLPRRGPWPFLASLAWAWVSGAATLGLLGLLASSLFDLPLTPGTCRGLAGLAAAAGATVRLVRGASRRPAGPVGAFRSRFLPLAAPAAVTLFLLLQAFVEPIKDQDGRMTWDLHARYMRAEQTASPLALRSPAVFVTHPQYPPLLPLLQTVALEAVGADPAEDRFVRPLYALFFPAAVLLVLQAAAPLAGAPAAAAAALVASALPALSLFDDGGPSSTYSDAPLGALFGGACLLLLRARSRPGATLVAALLLSAAVLAKNEGTLLAGGLLLAWSAGGLFRRAWKLASPRRLLLEALPWLAAIGARFLLVRWRAAIPNRWDEGYEQLSLAAIRPDVAARKLLAALPEILRAFADWRLWSVAWLLVALLLVVRGRTVLRAAAPRFVAWAALLPPAVGLLAYAVTPWGDVAGLVRVTWARFLLQGALPGLVLLALLLREPRDAGRSRVSRSA